MKLHDLPDFPEGLTPDLMTEILQSHGCLASGAAVDTVTLSPLGDGTGMSSELARVHFTYRGNRGTAPDTAVAKFLPNNETNRISALAFNLPERETRYAVEIDPKTEAVTPEIYCARLSKENFLILMEDLGDYTVGSQVVGATLRETELAIDELAKLHSAFWEKVDGLDWVPGVADSYHADALHQGSLIGWDNMVAQFDVPESINQYKERFHTVIPELQAARMRGPVTFVHGDYRMENLLFGNQPEHHEIVVIDWQGPLIARGLVDVTLFLTQSTKTEVRREHEEALLQRYFDGLVQRGVTGIDMDWIRTEYKESILYCWIYTSVVAGTLDTSNETAARWIAKMIERHIAASEDHQTFSVL